MTSTVPGGPQVLGNYNTIYKFYFYISASVTLVIVMPFNTNLKFSVCFKKEICIVIFSLWHTVKLINEMDLDSIIVDAGFIHSLPAACECALGPMTWSTASGRGHIYVVTKTEYKILHVCKCHAYFLCKHGKTT